MTDSDYERAFCASCGGLICNGDCYDPDNIENVAGIPTCCCGSEELALPLRNLEEMGNLDAKPLSFILDVIISRSNAINNVKDPLCDTRWWAP